MIVDFTASSKNILDIATVTAGKDLRRFAQCRDTVEIGLLLSGSATLQLLGRGYALSAGDSYTVSPNTVLSLTAFSKDARLLWLTFSMDMIHPHPEHFFYRDFWEPLTLGAMQLPPYLPVTHPVAPAIRSQLTELLHTTDRSQRFAALMDLCLLLIPYCLYPADSTPELGIANRTVRFCMIFILNHYHRQIRLPRIARYVKCHPNYLCNLFKAYTGMTVFEYLYHIRVEAAAELLRKEDLSISRVAEVTGFPSRNMFYKKFRQIMGQSPTTYRNQYFNH